MQGTVTQYRVMGTCTGGKHGRPVTRVYDAADPRMTPRMTQWTYLPGRGCIISYVNKTVVWASLLTILCIVTSPLGQTLYSTSVHEEFFLTLLELKLHVLRKEVGLFCKGYQIGTYLYVSLR